MTPPATQRTDLLEQSLLLERCKEGDPAAWNRLIGSCQAFIYRIARYLSGNDADACDITSQVFLRLYQHIDHCRCGSSFRSWLYRIVYNAYVDTCIRDGYRKHLHLDEPLSSD